MHFWCGIVVFFICYVCLYGDQTVIDRNFSPPKNSLHIADPKMQKIGGKIEKNSTNVENCPKMSKFGDFQH